MRRDAQLLILALAFFNSVESVAAGMYTFEKFSVPGLTNANFTGIDKFGSVSGFATLPGGKPLAFIRDANGTFEYFEYAPDEWTYPLGISEDGVIVGDTFDASHSQRGFVRTTDGVVTGFDVPATDGFQVNDINGLGQIVGLRSHNDGSSVVFVRQPNGEFRDFDVPDSVFDDGFGINDHGVVSGMLDLGASAFLLDTTDGSLTVIQVPGASNTSLFGINNSGDSVGHWYTPETGIHGFVRLASGMIEELTVPESLGTYPWAINDRGQVAGRYINPADGENYGFIATPVPEPTSMAIAGITLLAWLLGVFTTQHRCDRLRS